MVANGGSGLCGTEKGLVPLPSIDNAKVTSQRQQVSYGKGKPYYQGAPEAWETELEVRCYEGITKAT